MNKLKTQTQNNALIKKMLSTVKAGLLTLKSKGLFISMEARLMYNNKEWNFCVMQMI